MPWPTGSSCVCYEYSHTTRYTVLLIFLAPSGSPVSTQARAINSTTIELRWELPPPDEQNGIVTSFLINITVTETKATYIVNATDNAVNITELHPHYSYSLAVAAVTTGGTGPYSQPVSAVTHEDGKIF